MRLLGPSARRFLNDSLFWHAPVGMLRALAYTAIVLLVTLAVTRHAFVADPAQLKDEHAVISFELAMVRAFCGRPFFYSHAARVAQEFMVDTPVRAMPLRELIAQRAGSVQEYCRQAEWPVVNSENSLMLLETALLRMEPNLSFEGLGRRLHLIRLGILFAFVVLLVSLGASLWLATAALLASLVALNALPAFGYSVYPFLGPLVLALVTAYGLAMLHLAKRPLPAWLGAGVAVGGLSAFVANMRTSYLPVVALCLVASLLASWWLRAGDGRKRAELMRAVAFAACFLLGYVTFERVLIIRHLPTDRESRTGHSVMHPLVLALGVPETAFSREQGIRWEDAVGPAKAGSIDPDTDYLGPRYDRALKTYYWALWQTHTREMLSVYRIKFTASGTQMLDVLRSSPGAAGRVIAILLTPLSWLVKVIWLVVVYAVILLGCAVAFWRRRSPAAFALGLLTVAACVVQVESGIIYSLFVQQYHNFAGFYAMFISLAGVQVLVNGTGSRLR
jgi:hypothetical protein